MTDISLPKIAADHNRISFGLTLMVQEDSKPPVQAGDPGSSVLNRVEYGDRT